MGLIMCGVRRHPETIRNDERFSEIVVRRVAGRLFLRVLRASVRPNPVPPTPKRPNDKAVEAPRDAVPLAERPLQARAEWIRRLDKTLERDRADG